MELEVKHKNPSRDQTAAAHFLMPLAVCAREGHLLPCSNMTTYLVPAGDFLVMVSRLAFNTNMTNGLWVEKIWTERPEMASFLTGEYRQKLAEASEETQLYYALVNFISNLDDTNRVIFAKAIYDYASVAFGFEFNR